MIASFYVLGLMIGSLITGKIITFGRRNAYILATIVVFIGSALMQIMDLNIFMVGRLIAGIGGGMGVVVSARGIEEICPP